MKERFVTFIHNPTLVTTVSLILALIIGLVGYGYIVSVNKSINNNPPVVTNTDSTTTAGDMTSASQSVISNANGTVNLAFLAGGRVAAINVSVGDHIGRGEVLAKLDTQSTEGVLMQARAAYESAQAAYNKVENGASKSQLDVADTALQNAEQGLTTSLANAYTQAENTVRTDVDNLFVDPNSDSPYFSISIYDQTSGNFVTFSPNDSSEKLRLSQGRANVNTMFKNWLPQGYATLPDQTRTVLANLAMIKNFLTDVSNSVNTIYFSQTKFQTELAAIKTSVALARSTIDGLITSVTTAEQALNTAQANKDALTSPPRAEDVTAARAAMDSAHGALEVALANYNNSVITAPVDGTVTAIHIKVGEIATPNASAIEVSAQAPAASQ